MLQTKRHTTLQITTKMHHLMAEMLKIVKKISGRGQRPSPYTSPMGRGTLPIPHLFWRIRRLSSPSPDAEPSHFSFLSDAYD